MWEDTSESICETSDEAIELSTPLKKGQNVLGLLR